MFSSTNENNGFTAIGQNELETVNGGEPLTIFVTGVAVGIAATLIVQKSK